MTGDPSVTRGLDGWGGLMHQGTLVGLRIRGPPCLWGSAHPGDPERHGTQEMLPHLLQSCPGAQRAWAGVGQAWVLTAQRLSFPRGWDSRTAQCG